MHGVVEWSPSASALPWPDTIEQQCGGPAACPRDAADREGGRSRGQRLVDAKRALLDRCSAGAQQASLISGCVRLQGIASGWSGLCSFDRRCPRARSSKRNPWWSIDRCDACMVLARRRRVWALELASAGCGGSWLLVPGGQVWRVVAVPLPFGGKRPEQRGLDPIGVRVKTVVSVMSAGPLHLHCTHSPPRRLLLRFCAVALHAALQPVTRSPARARLRRLLPP